MKAKYEYRWRRKLVKLPWAIPPAKLHPRWWWRFVCVNNGNIMASGEPDGYNSKRAMLHCVDTMNVGGKYPVVEE